MNKGEKILFIIGLVLAVAAIVTACFAAYFGISAVISETLHSTTDQLARVFMLLLFVLFTLVSWSLSFLTLLCLFLRPVRSAHAKVRRFSFIALCLVAVFSLIDGVLWLICMI